MFFLFKLTSVASIRFLDYSINPGNSAENNSLEKYALNNNTNHFDVPLLEHNSAKNPVLYSNEYFNYYALNKHLRQLNRVSYLTYSKLSNLNEDYKKLSKVLYIKNTPVLKKNVETYLTSIYNELLKNIPGKLDQISAYKKLYGLKAKYLSAIKKFYEQMDNYIIYANSPKLEDGTQDPTILKFKETLDLSLDKIEKEANDIALSFLKDPSSPEYISFTEENQKLFEQSVSDNNNVISMMLEQNMKTLLSKIDAIDSLDLVLKTSTDVVNDIQKLNNKLNNSSAETLSPVLTTTEIVPGSTVTETNTEDVTATETVPGSTVTDTKTGDAITTTETVPASTVTDTKTGDAITTTETVPGSTVTDTKTGDAITTTETVPGSTVTETKTENVTTTETVTTTVTDTKTGVAA